MLLALAAIWGSKFMFIKVGVRELEPVTLIWLRVGLAAVVLAPFAVRHGAELRRAWWPLVVVGTLNLAVPFWLTSWSLTRIDSGLAAIIQAASPIFTAAIALRFVREERSHTLELAGLALGFAGVALVVGVQPHGELLAALAVVGAALCFAGATLYAHRRLAGVPPVAVAFGTLAAAALLTTPAGAAQLPDHVPGWKVIGSVVALGVGGSALAYLLYYALVAGAGASRAILVMYLVPPMAVLYGAAFLGEHLPASAFGGLVLVLGGVAFASGAVRFGRVPGVTTAVPPPRPDLG
jgi:drug/metabolite transporter (DMT)-like permease